MKYQEYQEIIKNTEDSKIATFKRAILWLHPEILPLGVIALEDPKAKIVKVPRKAINDFGRIVPVIAFAWDLFRNNKDVTDIILHSDINSIPQGAFAGCSSLKRITIPRAVKHIKEGTFDGCINLEDVYYEGSREDWENLDICHQRHEVEYGELIPGTPVERKLGERYIHIPGNDALFTCNIHFNCNLGSEAVDYVTVKAGGKDITKYLQTM